ncbi:MAG TPA: hypothetical protein VK589_07100, partial [Chryseolinea sp.]|nr:hypothetical protein [Chryseolinea sp.]
MLDVIMLAFVFTFSLPDANAIDRDSKCKLTISASPLDQIVFGDLSSFSGPLVNKIQFANNESGDVVINYPSFEIATRVAFLIAPSLYNTLYTNTTINAP